MIPPQIPGGGNSITKNGITFAGLSGDRYSLEAYNKNGTTCWYFVGRWGVKTESAPIVSVTFEILANSVVNPAYGYNDMDFNDILSSDLVKVYEAEDKKVGVGTDGDYQRWQSRQGSYYYDCYITKVIVEYIGD